MLYSSMRIKSNDKEHVRGLNVFSLHREHVWHLLDLGFENVAECTFAIFLTLYECEDGFYKKFNEKVKLSGGETKMLSIII